MPNITVELLAGRTLDQRRAFAEAVADSAVALLGARRQDVRMVFSEITPDVVANGGVLASEDQSRSAVVAAFGAGVDTDRDAVTTGRSPGGADGPAGARHGGAAVRGMTQNARG